MLNNQNAICLHKDVKFDDTSVNSFSSYTIVKKVSQINDFKLENLTKEEKEVLNVFLTELRNYPASQSMKYRFLARLEEGNFKSQLNQTTA